MHRPAELRSFPPVVAVVVMGARDWPNSLFDDRLQMHGAPRTGWEVSTPRAPTSNRSLSNFPRHDGGVVHSFLEACSSEPSSSFPYDRSAFSMDLACLIPRSRRQEQWTHKWERRNEGEIVSRPWRGWIPWEAAKPLTRERDIANNRAACRERFRTHVSASRSIPPTRCRCRMWIASCRFCRALGCSVKHWRQIQPNVTTARKSAKDRGRGVESW